MAQDRKQDLRALLVDDDEFVRSIVGRQLSSHGVGTVVTAQDGDAARSELAKGEPYDIILCDLMMPGTDGVALLRDIAELQPGIGVILISSADRRVLNTAEAVARERKLNVLGALAKPIKHEALGVLLERLARPVPASPTQAGKAEITAEDLKAALACGEIVVYVQPEIRIRDNQLSAVEALARWNSPVHGFVLPDNFIPLAESCGLIRELTDVTVRESIAACARWRQQGLDIRIAINISPFVLDDLALPETIAAVAREHDVPAGNLLLEVTESGVFRDVATSLDILTRFRLSGMRLALDDYGTGHSSLKQLLRVPFTELKLDRMFLTGSEQDVERRKIVESTINLAHELGLAVIAEGVETEEHLKLLTELGCEYAQGYLIARPMPVDQLLEWARQYAALPNGV